MSPDRLQVSLEQYTPVSLIEQSAVLEEVGAGIQLTPNASRVLIAPGLRDSPQTVAWAIDFGRIAFPYLLSMIPQSFMSRPNSIVCPGNKLDLAMQQGANAAARTALEEQGI